MLEYNLTQEQKELLKVIVDAYDAGAKGEFFFVQSHGGNGLVFHGQPNEFTSAGVLDFEQLAKEDLIDLSKRDQNWAGQPKAKGIEYAHQLFRDPHDPAAKLIWAGKQPQGYTNKGRHNLPLPPPPLAAAKHFDQSKHEGEFYSCFISYSSHDQAFAVRLHHDLRAQGLRVWFAPEDLKIGERFQESIEQSLKVYDKVIIVLSTASVESRWVEREVNAAREREDRETRTVLFPIRIDEAIMTAPQPWAADIRRSRHIGDFRDWEHPPSYEKAFDLLLRDLKATHPEQTDSDLKKKL